MNFPARALRDTPRRELTKILEARILTMLEFMLGPPPSAHGQLMLREMCDPTDAMPMIVAEFITPQTEEMEQLVGLLVPGVGREVVRQIVFSIVGQVLHRFTMPMMAMRRRRSTPGVRAQDRRATSPLLAARDRRHRASPGAGPWR